MLFLVVVLTVTASSVMADNELSYEESFGSMRTFNGFNSTYLLAAVAVGAVLVLLVGVGLYLYDYFNDDTYNKSGYSPDDYAAYYQDTYHNAEYAYPAQQYQSYRYVVVDTAVSILSFPPLCLSVFALSLRLLLFPSLSRYLLLLEARVEIPA